MLNLTKHIIYKHISTECVPHTYVILLNINAIHYYSMMMYFIFGWKNFVSVIIQAVCKWVDVCTLNGVLIVCLIGVNILNFQKNE